MNGSKTIDMEFGKIRSSTDPNTGKIWPLPETDLDPGLDKALESAAGKKVVVVQGLGFVGAVMALICANAEHNPYYVIGIDLPSQDAYWKIRSLNEGQFPIKADDPKIESYFQNAIDQNNFYATYDPRAYAFADVVIVDINLDVDKVHDDTNQLIDYNLSMDGFKAAIQSIGDRCKEDVLVLVESTVPPGTCKNFVHPIINKALADRNLSSEKWMLGHSYERVMPGTEYIDSIKNFYRVFSGIDERSAMATKVFLETIISTEKYPLTQLDNTNATEMAKVLENSYRAMNIAFMVEWSRFAEEAGVNIYEVVNAIRLRPTHNNMMFPGIGVGGYCLTKDPLLASWARQNIFKSDNLTTSEKAVHTNDLMPVYAFQFLQTLFEMNDPKNILLLGVSYRRDVGDTRSTPVEVFYNQLLNNGHEVKLHDPIVNYWEEQDLEVDNEINLVGEAPLDLICFTTGHSHYENNVSLIESILKLDPLCIYDTVGVLTDKEIDQLKVKHKVLVLGRGDL